VESNNFNPFNLTEENGRLYGCGVSDNKAPLLCWFNAIKMYKITKNEIPVNIKFVIEGTSEYYSHSLHNAILKNKKFFNDVEFICLTIDQKENDMPCLKYGYRGLCHFSLIVSCGDRKVHSGTYGGAFNQPLMDVASIFADITNKHGKIMIPHVRYTTAQI
jgi:acetylornithine deacetylase/succinyl-diaminopimelate desuccinylase-like protein